MPKQTSRAKASRTKNKLTATMQLARRVYSLAQAQNDAALLVGAHRALAATFHHLGYFEAAREHAKQGIQLWTSGAVRVPVEEVNSPIVVCLCFEALCEWHFGETTAAQAAMVRAISLAEQLGDAYASAVTRWFGAVLGHLERNPAEVEVEASFCDAIRTAKRQKSISRRKRAEASYEEYRGRVPAGVSARR